MAKYTIDPQSGKKTLANAGTANPAGITPGASGQAPEKKAAPAAKAKAAAPKTAVKDEGS